MLPLLSPSLPHDLRTSRPYWSGRRVRQAPSYPTNTGLLQRADGGGRRRLGKETDRLTDARGDKGQWDWHRWQRGQRGASGQAGIVMNICTLTNPVYSLAFQAGVLRR